MATRPTHERAITCNVKHRVDDHEILTGALSDNAIFFNYKSNNGTIKNQASILGEKKKKNVPPQN